MLKVKLAVCYPYAHIPKDILTVRIITMNILRQKYYLLLSRFLARFPLCIVDQLLAYGAPTYGQPMSYPGDMSAVR